MAILIDPPAWPFRGTLFSHLASDTSIAQLHAFAARCGLHPRSYDGDHYDVPEGRYAELVAAGARPVSNRELLAAVRGADLRFRKRRGERPLASLPDVLPHVDGPHHLELVRSSIETPAEATHAAAVIVADPRGRVLLVRDGGGWRLPGALLPAGITARAAAARAVQGQTGLDVSAAALVAFGYARIRPRVTRIPAENGSPRAQAGLLPHAAVFSAAVGRGALASAATFTSEGTQARAGRAGPAGPHLPGSPGAASALGGAGPVTDIAWAGTEEVVTRCSSAPWWPLLARYLED